MNINIKRKILLKELLKVSRIISPKILTPSLFGILIEVKKNRIILIASDGELSIKSEIFEGNDLIIKSTGIILIKNKFIIEIIHKIEDEYIIIKKIKENLIKIKTNNFNLILNILNYMDYPRISFNIKNEEKEIKFNKKQLKEIIVQTAFAIGEEEKRMIFNGLNIKNDKEKKNLIITATDSFRLACKKINYTLNGELDVIVPGKFINEINKIISENNNNNETVTLKVNKKFIYMLLNNIIIQSKIVEGKYPDTTKIISNNFVTIMTLRNNKFIKVIERASVLSSETMSSIVTLKIKNNRVFVMSFIQEIGSSEEEIKNINFNLNVTDQTISFNSKYMLDALKAFKTENITIKIIDKLKPLVIVSEEELSLQQLVLPIRSY